MIKDYGITPDMYMSSSTICDIEFAGKQICDNHKANIKKKSYLYLQMSQTYSTLYQLLTPM